MPTSNFQPIRLLDPNCWYKFTYLWQTVQIQISLLLQKSTDLDLHCLQRQGISGFSKTRVNSRSYGPLALIQVYTIHQPTVHVCTRFQHVFQILRKMQLKVFIYGELTNLSRDVSPKVIGPWPWFWYTRYLSPLSMRVPSFNLIAFTVPEKSVSKNFH